MITYLKKIVCQALMIRYAKPPQKNIGFSNRFCRISPTDLAGFPGRNQSEESNQVELLT
jgi:hypothetical protein